MILTRRSSSAPLCLILGCLMALGSAPLSAADATLNFTDAQIDSTNYSVFSGDTLTLDISSGTATYGGQIGGLGNVAKDGAGTLVFTNSNAYLGSTTLKNGVLELATGGYILGSNNLYAGSAAGESGMLRVSGGIMGSGSSFLGSVADSTGTVAMTSGTFNSDHLYVGYYGTGVVNLSGGLLTSSDGSLGMYLGSQGTVSMSGGNWGGHTLAVGAEGTGIFNLSSGTVDINSAVSLGSSATGNGTLNVSGGTFSSDSFKIGEYGTGVLNLSGGTVTTTSTAEVGSHAGATGTVNVSGGTWTVNGDFLLGAGSTGTLNVTGSGVVNAGATGQGTLSLASDTNDTGTVGVLNMGTGGLAGTLNAALVTSGPGAAFVNFNHSNDIVFNAELTGTMTVTKSGSGTTALTAASSYTGATVINGGTLELAFGTVGSYILPGSTSITLSNGTLKISNSGSGSSYQVLSAVAVQPYSAATLVMGANTVLNLSGLATLGTQSALYIDAEAGGVIGPVTGTSHIFVDILPDGPLAPTVTMKDAGGFGLAEIFAGQVIRATDTPLLPATGADADTNYLINNNAGGPSAAGSSSLVLGTSTETASITVDTTAGVGILTIGAGSTLYNNVWNFGGLGNNAYSIVAGDSGSALSASVDGNIQINNFNAAPVTISAPITSNGTNDLIIEGTGKIIFTSTSSVAGNTSLVGGTVVLEGGATLRSNDGVLTVGLTAGGQAVLDVKQGYVDMHDIIIASDTFSTGQILIGKDQHVSAGYSLTVGQYGNGFLNIDGGRIIGDTGAIAALNGSTGTVLVQNHGSWSTSGDLTIGDVTTGGLSHGTLTLVTSSFVDLRESSGVVTMAAGSTINYGLGGSAGYLGTRGITGLDPSATVNFNFSYDYDTIEYYTPLNGSLSLNKMGSGLLIFDNQKNFVGSTTVNGGILMLRLFEVPTDILSSSSALVLGGGTFSLRGAGTQTLNGLTTTASTGSAIQLLNNNETLYLGALTMGAHSALNFDTSAAGADGATTGPSNIVFTGLTAGTVISNSFTVQDRTGFGLATVNASGQVIRLTDTPLLPVSGASASVDYLIDNNDGGYSAAGSSQMMIDTSESARSITVDTTNASGSMSLNPGVVVGADVWNFGGNVADNNYFIFPGPFAYGTGVGIQSTTAGGVMQINNYSAGRVYIGVGILDNDGSGLLITGTNATVLAGTDTYTGATTVNSGILIIEGDHSGATGATTVQTGGALGGTGTMGGDIIVQAGGTLTPGSYLYTGYQGGTLNGTTATFQSGSVFSVHGSGATLPTLHLTGAVTIASGAYFSLLLDNDLTESSYTLLTAESGLDGSSSFTLMDPNMLPEGYKLVYTGTALQLNITAPAVAYWTGAVSNKWSDLGDGSSNWATTVDGTTDTHSIPAALTDVYFAADNAASTDTVLDTDFTINSLTVNTDTSISRDEDPQTLTVVGATTVNAQLAVNFGVTLSAASDLTVSNSGTLAGDGTVAMAEDRSMYIYGAISVGNPNPDDIGGAQLTLTTSGTGAVVMGSSSVVIVELYYGAGDGSNLAPGQIGASDQLNLHGKLDATAGGTLVIQNPNTLTAFAGGDQWQLINLNAGNNPGSIEGQLAVDDSSLGLAAGLVGNFDQSTGIYSIVDYRGELSALYSGLPMANAEMQGVIAAAQTATTDVNGHLFNLRNGDGEEEDEGDDSISAALDYGVVEGQGDGPEEKNPMARRIRASRQWQVFATVNYGNVRLNPISNQAGVQIDSWASSVGIERHLSRGLTLGFAATFLQSTQNYTSGLGSMHLDGPTLSTYLAYARKGMWASLMYSFGDYDLDSSRNPGFGMPVANGSTTAYVNSVQFNTGYNFRFQNNTFVTGPFVGVDYLHGSVDAYTETGGGAGALAFGKQSFESLVARVGWSAAKKLHTNWAEITPQVRVSYERQNIHNNGTSVQSIIVPFSATGGNQNPGQDYMVLGGGVNFQFTPSLSLLLNYQTQIFRDNMTSHFGSIRLGYKF